MIAPHTAARMVAAAGHPLDDAHLMPAWEACQSGTTITLKPGNDAANE